MVNILDNVATLLVGRGVEPRLRPSELLLSAARGTQTWAVNVCHLLALGVHLFYQ